ncbi:MAG: hypothetical protein ACJAS9_001234 [Polaribacter sp.]|jgi:hypothetical protein
MLMNIAKSIASSIPINAQQAPPVNTAPPQASPLDDSPLNNLRDIHLPENIDQFPLAIGWWILLSILICTLCFIIIRAIKKQRALRYLRSAKLELKSLSQLEANNESISKLSALLKRVCLIYYPANLVASINGQAWWDFINYEAGKNIFTKGDVKQMSQSRYQKNASVDKAEYSSMVNKIEKSIELIIRKAIKNKKPSKTNQQSLTDGIA